ncbi:unnamed protein product [Prunus brigantina]
MTGRTRPRMGSVNTPATPTTRTTLTLGLATFSPTHTQSYLPSYDGTYPASYGVCQHPGYSYDTFDLNTITIFGVRHFNLPRMLTLPRKSHGQPRVKLPNLGQTGPRGPRPPNSDPKVPIGSTGSRTHVLKFGPDWTVGSLTIARSDGY